VRYRVRVAGKLSRVQGPQRTAAIGTILLLGIVAGGASPAASNRKASARVRVQVEGPSFLGTVTPTGTKRPESVVWWNDGSWWADMWDARGREFHIFRFSARARRWVDAMTVVDRRVKTGADALWDGSHLYIATHKQLRDTEQSVPGPPSYLFRFSYSHRRHRYTLDAGFPTVINRYRTETLVIDEDTTGKLWATWQQGSAIYVASTTRRRQTWGRPFRLRFPQAAVTLDDISSVVAFSGRIGVMWSNQTTGQDGFWFSVHRDGAPEKVWQPPQAALAGNREADDHINLKSDSRGIVYAAVKTSNIHVNPLLLLLTRDVGGRWTGSIYGAAPFCHNRPTLVIDEQRRLVHMFATAPAPPTYRCTTSGGAIYEKSAPLDRISFPAGRGTMVLDDAGNPFIHNASTSKRNVPSRAGLLLLAINEKTHQYWTLYVK
jgi:hypothetical protein